MKRKTAVSWRLELPLLTLILLLGGVLRLGWPGLTEFKADEARLLTLALEMVSGDGLALRGISNSVGVPNFPASVWLYALPSFLSTHPYAATLFTGLLNLLALAGCYWLVRRIWGVEAALAATLLFAVSPWAIHHSRKIWAQNLLAFWVVLWGIGAWLAYGEKRGGFLILHILALAVAIQIHTAGIGLIPATAVLLLWQWRQVQWRHLLLSGGLVGLTVLPFAVFLVQSGAIGQLVAGGVSSGGEAAYRPLAAGRHAWRLFSGWEIHALAGPVQFENYLAMVPSMTAVRWLWGLLLLVGVAVMLMQLRRGQPQDRVAVVLLLLWLFSPIATFMLPGLPVELHYLLPIYPAPFVIGGVAVASLRGWLRAGGWILAGGTAVLQVWAWAGLLSFVTTTATPGGFGTPLHQQLVAVEAAKELVANGEATEILVMGEGDNPGREEFPAIYEALLFGVPHRYVNGMETAVFPAGKTAVLLADGVLMGEMIREAGAVREAVPYREGEDGVAVVMLMGPVELVPEIVVEPVVILENWASIVGVGQEELSIVNCQLLIANGGECAGWLVFWNVGEMSGADFQMFGHLLAEDGGRLGQWDTAVFPATQWRQGDRVVTLLPLPDLDEASALRLGMYRFPSLEPVQLFDVAGNLTADFLVIELND